VHTFIRFSLHSRYFSFHSSAHHRDLPSFPTRRSSDLGTRLAQVGDHRLLVGALFGATVELGERDDRDLQLLGEQLEVPGHVGDRSEEHTSELQSRENLVCRLLLEKKKNTDKTNSSESK